MLIYDQHAQHLKGPSPSSQGQLQHRIANMLNCVFFWFVTFSFRLWYSQNVQFGRFFNTFKLSSTWFRKVINYSKWKGHEDLFRHSFKKCKCQKKEVEEIKCKNNPKQSSHGDQFTVRCKTTHILQTPSCVVIPSGIWCGSISCFLCNCVAEEICNAECIEENVFAQFA